MERQCPYCRAIVSFSDPKCQHCGQKFFDTSKRRTFSDTCIRIGGGAVLLAAVTVIVLRLM